MKTRQVRAKPTPLTRPVKTKPLTIYVEPALWAAVKARAQADRRSVGNLLRKIVEEDMERYELARSHGPLVHIQQNP